MELEVRHQSLLDDAPLEVLELIAANEANPARVDLDQTLQLVNIDFILGGRHGGQSAIHQSDFHHKPRILIRIKWADRL